MNLATQLSNQTNLKEINPDYECNGTLKTPSDISPIEPLKGGKAIYDGRVDDEQYTEEISTKDEIKVESLVFEEDSPMMTNVSTKDTVIKEEKPNKWDSGICDNNSLICHASEALTQAEKNKSSSEESEALRYVKEEEITTEESYVEENEAVETRDSPIMTNESTKDSFIKEEKPNSILKSDSGIGDSNSLSWYARQALIEGEKNKSSNGENEPLRYVKEEEITVEESCVMINEAVEGVGEDCKQLVCTMNATSTYVKKEKREFTGRERVHTNKQPFKCTICNKRFKLKRSLKLHGQSMHTLERPFQCAICSKGFVRKIYLMAHERVHTKDRPFECAICGKSFTQKSCLTRHKQLHTDRDRPYKCAICNKDFTQKLGLTRHEQLHTDRDCPFKCAICNTGFIHKAHLIVHERMHTNDRPFKCAICINSFTRKSDLAKHERVHTKDRPFRCAVCSKGFTQKSSLTRHEQRHTSRDRPFECAICNKSFIYKAHLIVHERNHTNDPPSQCAI